MVGIPPSSLFIASRPSGLTSVRASNGNNVTVTRHLFPGSSIEGLSGSGVRLEVTRSDYNRDGTPDRVTSDFSFRGSDSLDYHETTTIENGQNTVSYYRFGSESRSGQDLNGDGRVETDDNARSVHQNITAERFEAEQAIVQAYEPRKDGNGVAVIDESNVDVTGANLVNQPPPPPDEDRGGTAS